MRVTERLIAFAIGAALGALACFALLMAISDNRGADQRAEIQALQSQLAQRDSDLQSRKKIAEDAAANSRDRIAFLQKSLDESEAKIGALKNERDGFEAKLTRVEAELRAKTEGPDAAQLTTIGRLASAVASDKVNAVDDVILEDGRFRFTDLQLSINDAGCRLSGEVTSSQDEPEPVLFRLALFDEHDQPLDAEVFSAKLPHARQPKAFEEQIKNAPGRYASQAYRFKISVEER